MTFSMQDVGPAIRSDPVRHTRTSSDLADWTSTASSSGCSAPEGSDRQS